MSGIGTHTAIPLPLAGKRYGEPLSHLHDLNHDIPWIDVMAGLSLLIDPCPEQQPHAPVE